MLKLPAPVSFRAALTDRLALAGPTTRIITTLAAIAIAALATAPALAQSAAQWPDRPVRLLVPVGAGGPGGNASATAVASPNAGSATAKAVALGGTGNYDGVGSPASRGGQGGTASAAAKPASAASQPCARRSGAE